MSDVDVNVKSGVTPTAPRRTPLLMESTSLTALVDRHVQEAKDASRGRSSHTIYGGHEHHLRQTLIALAAGQSLDEHESPGEATLQVLRGRGALLSDGATIDGGEGTVAKSLGD